MVTQGRVLVIPMVQKCKGITYGGEGGTNLLSMLVSQKVVLS